MLEIKWVHKINNPISSAKNENVKKKTQLKLLLALNTDLFSYKKHQTSFN